MEKSKSSYLMEEIYYDINAELKEYTTNFSNDLIHIPQFLTEPELEKYDLKIATIRRGINLSMLEAQSVGKLALVNKTYKYICHEKGRYDIWPIAEQIKTPDFLKNFTQKTIGCLFLDEQTITEGKFHKDTVDLFPDLPNSVLPPFYYNMLVATCDQEIENGPTVFYLNNSLWWVKLKRGDALVFNGEIIHRGTPNLTNKHRDMIYSIYTKQWYNEEIL